VICINNLGSNYGSSSPLDPGWPPSAVLSTLDQARAIWQALDAIGVDAIHLAAGGSLGGMIIQALAALRPTKVARIMVIGAAATASSWVIGLNHVQRQAIALDPGFPCDVSRGLEVARQIAMLTYRAEPGLAISQPTSRQNPISTRDDHAWRYPIASYLEHQGAKLRRRFDGRSYLAMLDAMDTHDFFSVVALAEPASSSSPFAKSLVVDIDTDVLFTRAAVEELASAMAIRGSSVTRATMHSMHGHDAFLIEWDQMHQLCAQAMQL
jgi:homoserine O-acetyltransferase/O-succinyltransferase